MRVPTLHNGNMQPSWRSSGNVMPTLAVVSIIAVMGAFFFWPDSTSTPAPPDPEVLKALQFIGASQPRTQSGIKAINDNIAAEHARLSMMSDQIAALVDRLKALESIAPQILRDNANLAEQLKATQNQITQENASLAEQLKDLTKLALANTTATVQVRESQEQMAGTIAKVSGEVSRPAPLPVRQRPATALAAPKRTSQGTSTNTSTTR
jgi:septal ring factor EnvC (AmiA/AmiB activator)